MADIIVKIVGMDGAVSAELEANIGGLATHLVVRNTTNRAVDVTAIGVTTEQRTVLSGVTNARTAVSPTLGATRGVDNDTGNAGLSLAFTPVRRGR